MAWCSKAGEHAAQASASESVARHCCEDRTGGGGGGELQVVASCASCSFTRARSLSMVWQFCAAGRRSAGCACMCRHGEDAAGARGGQPHGRLLHPRHRQRAGAEVCGRGRAHGARAVPGAPAAHSPTSEVTSTDLSSVQSMCSMVNRRLSCEIGQNLRIHVCYGCREQRNKIKVLQSTQR